LPVGGVGAAELIQRPSRRARGYPAIFDRGRDIGRSDVGRAFDIRRLVRIGGVGGEPIAQHEIGRLRAGQGWRCRDRDHSDGDAADRSE